MRHRRGSGRSGFTLVELLVGMIAGAILALTAGAMLYFGFRALSSNSRAAELQRDGSIAMHAIGWSLREASAADVSVVGGQIRVGTNAFYRSGDDFLYDPDTTRAGGEAIIVKGTMTGLTAVLAPGGLAASMTLQAGEDRTQLDGAWAFRN